MHNIYSPSFKKIKIVYFAAMKKTFFTLCSSLLLLSGCGPQMSSLQPQTDTQIVDGKIVANNSKLWKNGRKLRLLFLDGNEATKHRVIQHARQWTQYANIDFEFVTSPPAEIRVTFRARGNHSYLGTDALTVKDQGKHTLSLSALSANKEDSSRTILHELGHALGIEHEHLSPNSTLQLDREKIKRDCFVRYGFKEDVCEHAIFKEIDEENVTAFDFDPHSVMGYDFHHSHYKTGSVQIAHIGGLSLGDKLGIAAVYPGKAEASDILVNELENRNMVSSNGKCEILKNICAPESYMVRYTTMFGNLKNLGVCSENYYEALSVMTQSSKCR